MLTQVTGSYELSSVFEDPVPGTLRAHAEQVEGLLPKWRGAGEHEEDGRSGAAVGHDLEIHGNHYGYGRDERFRLEGRAPRRGPSAARPTRTSQAFPVELPTSAPSPAGSPRARAAHRRSPPRAASPPGGARPRAASAPRPGAAGDGRRGTGAGWSSWSEPDVRRGLGAGVRADGSSTRTARRCAVRYVRTGTQWEVRATVADLLAEGVTVTPVTALCVGIHCETLTGRLPSTE